MKRRETGERRKGGRNTLNTVVNVAILLFLGYAVLGPRGPLRRAIQEYASAFEARREAQNVLEQLAFEGRVAAERPTIIEFTDFQCPYCRNMHDVLMQGVAESKFDLVIMHFPLEQIHPLAKPAAKASLCAEVQGSAKEMNDLLMSTRDWMNDTDWRRLAREAGVPNLGQYEECLDARGTEQELARQRAVADNIGVRATPTFVSYGGVHSGVATLEELVQLTKR